MGGSRGLLAWTNARMCRVGGARRVRGAVRDRAVLVAGVGDLTGGAAVLVGAARNRARILIAALLAMLAVAAGLPSTALAAPAPATVVVRALPSVPLPPAPLPTVPPAAPSPQPPPPAPPPSPPPPPPPCHGERDTYRVVQEQIAAHNARPHTFRLPAEAGQLAAYDAEAAQLRAAQQTVITTLQTCLHKAALRAQALAALTVSGSGGPVVRMAAPESVRSALDQARREVSQNWTAPGRSPGRPWRVEQGSPVRRVYEILRKGNPGEVGDVSLRGQPRPRVGDADPAYPATRIGARRSGRPNVSPDHIIPLAEIVQMPGFTRLSPDDMYLIANSPINLQWLSGKANLAKSSRSAGDMLGVDTAWRDTQIALENKVRAQLQDLIDRLLISQG